MNCFTHSRSAAVGMCAICQKGVCHECVARQTPRLMCTDCAAHGEKQSDRGTAHGEQPTGKSSDGQSSDRDVADRHHTHRDSRPHRDGIDTRADMDERPSADSR